MLAIEIGPAMAATIRLSLRSNRLRVIVSHFEVADIMVDEADAVFGECLPLDLPTGADR